MQAGYRTDPRALAKEAKSRKAAVRNSKLDKALYGVDIDTDVSESKKSPKMISVGTQTDSGDTPSASAITVSSSMAPTVASTATSMTPNYRFLRPNPVSISSPSSSISADYRSIGTITPSNFSNSPMTPSMTPSISPASSVTSSNLRALSEQLNVSSPSSSVSSVGSYTDNRPPAITIPAPREIITAADIGDRTRAASMQNDALIANLQDAIRRDIVNPMIDSAFENANAAKIQRNVRAVANARKFKEGLEASKKERLQSAINTPLPDELSELYKDTLNNMIIPSNIEETKLLEPATTPEQPEIKEQPVVTVQAAPPILKDEFKPPESEAATEQQSSITGTPDMWTEDVMKAADEFMDAFHKNIREKKLKYVDQTTFTIRDSNGNNAGIRATIKPHSNPLIKWDIFSKAEGNRLHMNFRTDANIDPTKYNLVKSLQIAKENVPNFRQKYNRKTETNGLGLEGDDSINLKSPRVVFASRRGDPGVKSGQLYVMWPQLIKGNVRLYNKSGSTLVTKDGASDAFLRIARDIVNRNTFDARDMGEITDPKESALVNKFVMHTKPIMPSGIDSTINVDQVKQLKKRYETLVGELAAGNHGKLIRDEMVEILRKLMRMGIMATRKAERIIKQLREF